MRLKNKALILTSIIALLPFLFPNRVAHAQFQNLIPSIDNSFIAFISMIVFILVAVILCIISIVKFASRKNKPGLILLSIGIESLIIGVVLLFFI